MAEILGNENVNKRHRRISEKPLRPTSRNQCNPAWFLGFNDYTFDMPVVGFTSSSKKPARRYSSDPSERARQLVAEGKLGGARPGAGRPRKSVADTQKRKRASTVITEAARENADKIAGVFNDVIGDPDASRHIKLRAAKLAIDIEHREDAHAREEDDRLGGSRGELPQDRDALVDALAQKLAGNPLLAAQLGAVLSRAAELAGLPPQSRQTDARGPENALSRGD